MNNEIELIVNLIVNAIESLRPENNFFKDYVIPLSSPFFASLLGAGIAGYLSYNFFHYQEGIKQEKAKLDATNRWTLLLDEAKYNLIGVKNNYHGKLNENPFDRLRAIPTILFINKPILEDYDQISFLVPKQSNEKPPKWSSIQRIRTLIHNYNFLQELWIKRNELERKVKEKIVKQYSTEIFANVSLQQVFECVGKIDYVTLIDLNVKWTPQSRQ